MVGVFDLLLKLYPREVRDGFGEEMRAVFLESTQRLAGESACPTLWREYAGLLLGAARERWRQWGLSAGAMAGGAVFASALQFLLYWYLVPGKGKELTRVLQHLASRVFVVCLLVGIACGQQTKQDPATLELARSIYSASFGALRDAKTMEEMRKVSDSLDSPEWISVDRFGRTILTKQEADRDLESLLALPPERRAAGMDLIWAERDEERLIVVAWMMPNETQRVDADGASHKLSRGTLIRDIFLKTADGWRRIRHDKLLPNDTVLAVDGVPKVLPPGDTQHHVAPAAKQ